MIFQVLKNIFRGQVFLTWFDYVFLVVNDMIQGMSQKSWHDKDDWWFITWKNIKIKMEVRYIHWLSWRPEHPSNKTTSIIHQKRVHHHGDDLLTKRDETTRGDTMRTLCCTSCALLVPRFAKQQERGSGIEGNEEETSAYHKSRVIKDHTREGSLWNSICKMLMLSMCLSIKYRSWRIRIRKMWRRKARRGYDLNQGCPTINCYCHLLPFFYFNTNFVAINYCNHYCILLLLP